MAFSIEEAPYGNTGFFTEGVDPLFRLRAKPLVTGMT
jgi:hypothetical protein